MDQITEALDTVLRLVPATAADKMQLQPSGATSGDRCRLQAKVGPFGSPSSDCFDDCCSAHRTQERPIGAECRLVGAAVAIGFDAS